MMEKRSSDWRGGRHIREEWMARGIRPGNPVTYSDLLNSRTVLRVKVAMPACHRIRV